MNAKQQRLYVKFHVDNGPLKLMDAFIISEDQERVTQWTADSQSPTEANALGQPEITNVFRQLTITFDKSIKSFRESVPFVMQLIPLMLRYIDDQSIREFTKQHGLCIEADEEFETYGLGIDNFGEITRRVEKTISIRSGVDNLPDMFFLGLVSAYDKYLSDLVRTIFISQPQILSSSERNLSFSDLVEIGSIEAARERIIEKEIETVLRKSHADQIGWLESKLNIPLRKDLDIWPDFIELCERRNLLTHNGGKISQQYIKACSDNGVNVDKRIIGEILSADPKYYEHAVDVILEFGVKLAQVIWRKLLPAEIDQAAQQLNEFGYELITERKYKLAAKMLRFGLKEMKKHGTEATRKMMVVNYANAEKLAGNVGQSKRILDQEDWSAATDNYRISVAAVKDDLETVITLMPRVVESGLMRASAFREWPVFQALRSEAKFIDAFERVFSEKLIAERETTKRESERIDIKEAIDETETSTLMTGDTTIH